MIAHYKITQLKSDTSTLWKLFFKHFWRTSILFVGPLIPLFGLLVISILGFKAEVDSLIFMLHCPHVTKSSDSPLVGHLLASWWPAWQLNYYDPCTCEQPLVGLKSSNCCAAASQCETRQPFMEL